MHLPFDMKDINHLKKTIQLQQAHTMQHNGQLNIRLYYKVG